MSAILMKCGCRSNSLYHGRGDAKIDPPIPACVVHECYEPAATAPDLTGRIAKCGDHAPKPSSLDLAFFEFCGPGSREATDICVCGYATVAHEKHAGKCPPNSKNRSQTGAFKPRGAREFDRYYCGCRGWD